MHPMTCCAPTATRGAAPPPRGLDHPQLDDVDPDDVRQDFSEEEVVCLHWLLLEKIQLLCDSHAPLAEKFELMRWIFTDPVHDRQPFSFVNCVRVVGCSPLSQLPFIGLTDAEAIRAWIAHRLPMWLDATLALYPRWVADAVRANPAWVAERLERNPQWLNEQARRHGAEDDLFE